MISKFIKYIFGDWTKWEIVSCAESLGYVIVIQKRTERRTGKIQLNRIKIWYNALPREYEEFKDSILNKKICT